MTRKTINFMGAVLIGGLLAGCAPFIDSRREAGQSQPVGQSTKNRIAICYNPLWTGEETIQTLANEACAAQKKKAISDTTNYFNCTFITPNTAFFKCE